MLEIISISRLHLSTYGSLCHIRTEMKTLYFFSLSCVKFHIKFAVQYFLSAIRVPRSHALAVLSACRHQKGVPSSSIICQTLGDVAFSTPTNTTKWKEKELAQSHGWGKLGSGCMYVLPLFPAPVN